MASFVTNQYRGRLSTLDGAPLTVALMDATYVGGADDTDLSSVTGELDAQDAPGYQRQTVTGVWDPVDGVLRWDTPPSFDAAGADEIQTILIADSGGDIVAGLVWSTPVAGVDGMIPDVEHVAAVADEAGVVARLDDHETRIVALEQAPGGGIVEIVPGSGIDVDDTDPERPIVSATGGGGGGGDVSLSWESWPTGPHLATVAVVGEMPTGDEPPTSPAGLARFVLPYITTPLVDDGGPVQLGTISPNHLQYGDQLIVPVTWVDTDTMTTGQGVIAVQPTGEVMAQDMSGTLTDVDEVLLPLAGIEWLTLMGAQ